MSETQIIETTLGKGPRKESGALFRVVERVLRAIIPAANPDFELSYAGVTKWWIEIRSEGEPQRELGFDERGEVIVAGPLGSNFGFFTDSDAVFVAGEHPSVDQALFEEAWSDFEHRWSERRPRKP